MEGSQHHVQEIEHTADWAIRVRARNLRGLFVGAARGMFGLLADLSGLSAKRHFEIDLYAIDAETLLIDWLNELLFLAEEHGLVFVEFELQELSVEDGVRLKARAAGDRPDALFKVIKAATFGGLSIAKYEDGLQVELVFDV